MIQAGICTLHQGQYRSLEVLVFAVFIEVYATPRLAMLPETAQDTECQCKTSRTCRQQESWTNGHPAFPSARLQVLPSWDKVVCYTAKVCAVV